MHLAQRPAARYAPQGQFALWCRSCGVSATLVRGFCRACYAARRRDLLRFAGLRSRIIERDRHACRVCGEPKSAQRLHVHHRKPGVSREKLLIALCPGHHALVHKLQVLDRLLPPLLAELWREQHPGAPEQLMLGFGQQAVPASTAAWLWEEARLA
jgi:hypothetical protein